jgi:hypothetical protein
MTSSLAIFFLTSCVYNSETRSTEIYRKRVNTASGQGHSQDLKLGRGDFGDRTREESGEGHPRQFGGKGVLTPQNFSNTLSQSAPFSAYVQSYCRYLTAYESVGIKNIDVRKLVGSGRPLPASMLLVMDRSGTLWNLSLS